MQTLEKDTTSSMMVFLNLVMTLNSNICVILSETISCGQITFIMEAVKLLYF